MRVGIVTAEYPPAIGGVGDHARRLARELVSLGHAVQVVTSGGQRLGGQTAPPGEVHVLPVVRRWNWRILPDLRRFAHLQAWDVLHIHYQPGAYALHPAITVLPLWLRLGRRPPTVVTTFHDLRVPYLFPKAGPLRRQMVRLMARHSHGVIAVAEEDYRPLIGWTLGSGRRAAVEVVPLGNHFDADPPPGFDRSAWRAAIGVPETAFVVGHLGLVNRSKGVDRLAGAVAALRAAGRDVRLLMIGETLGASDPTNVRYLAEVKRIVKVLALTTHVHWTDYEPPDRVAGWLRCLDLAVLPFADGATLRRTSLIGAWSQRVPVLTTEPNYAAGWLRAGAAAIVAGGDRDRLAAAIAQLQDDPDRRRAIATAGHAYSSRFAWPEVARRTLAVYRAAHQFRDS